jgi:general secretion pathway protein D
MNKRALKFVVTPSLAVLLAAGVLPLSAQDVSPLDAEAAAAKRADQEQTKRMENSLALTTSLDEAGKLVQIKDYTKARARYQSVIEQATGGGPNIEIRARAQKELAALAAIQAREAESERKFTLARNFWQEAASLDPSNPAYAAGLRAVELKDPPLSQQYGGNTAATPELLEKVTKIQKLLFEGDSFHSSGQYQRAISRYKEILTIDPYHKVARQRIERTEKAKYRAASVRLDARREKALAEVDEAYATRPVPRQIAPVENVTQNATPTNVAGIYEKLESIIIPELNFTDVDVADAVRFLNEQSKALDPERKGINFVLKANPTTSAASAGNEAPPPIQRSITLNLRQVPLIEVLNFIKNLTNLQYKVEEYAVFIFPSTETSDVLVIRSFSVPPSFFTVTPRPTGEVGATGVETVQFVTADVKQELEQKGVKFPAGASAAYLPRSNKLIVRNTLDQINLIGQLLADQSDISTQIEIETKFIEFSQDKLKDLSFTYRFDSNEIVPAPLANLIGDNYLSNAGNLADDARPVRVETNLRTAGDLPNSNIDALLGLGGNRAPNTISFGAILGGNGASMLISALESAVGADLMSAPKVTVVNGQQAKIRVVRELIYPTEYEAPEIVNSAQGSTGGVVGGASFNAVPSTPGGFETRDVGVILEVKADATQDRRISLELTPEVTEFQGFINYGGDVREATAPDDADPITGEGQVRVQGVALTPVFSIRKVTTKLNVVDGQTVVMGGFIREDSNKFQDKIPLLGDIPLVGRLFRSESERSIKRNLVIFTTARIINPDGKPKFLTASELDAMETLEVGP